MNATSTAAAVAASPWPFADQLPYPVTLRTPDDVPVHANPAALAHFGYRLADVVGRTGDELHKDAFGETLRAVHRRLCAAALADGGSHSELLRTPGKQGLGLVRLTVFPFADNGGTLIASMLIDETDSERARIADDHRRSVQAMDDSMLSSFIHNSPVIVVLRDRELKFVDVSDSVCAMFNIARHDFVGNDDIDVAVNKDAARERQAVIRQVLEGSEPALVEERFPAIEDLVVLFHHFPLLDRDGQPFAVGTVGIDVSGWRAAEQTVDHQARQLQEFTIASAHDLKEPLRTVSGFLTMVIDDLEADEPLDRTALVRQLRPPLQSALRMGDLVNGMLELGNINQRDLAPQLIDLDALLDDVRMDLSERIADTDGQVVSGHLGTIWGDRTRLRQLLQNLIGNGLKFRRPDVSPVVRVSANIDAGSATIMVADNGIGVPKESREQVFGAFERLHPRSRYDGSGLGLARCRAIAHRHGGRIRMHANLRSGTIVSCELPAPPAQPDAG